MTYNLRSSGISKIDMNEANDDDSVSNEFDKLEALLKPIEESLSGLRTSLNEIRTYFEAKVKRQQGYIDILLTRIKNIESRLNYSDHISILHERRLDDLEQVSRKINLKICGIEVGSNDSPHSLMKQITDEYLGDNGVDLQLSDFDRCHRVGPRHRKGDKWYTVMLKMCSWRARDMIYKNRRRFRFFVIADLTTRRQELFNFAKKELESSSDDEDLGESDAIVRTVEYLFCDENCKLKLKSTTGRYYMFSSKEEFYCIVSRLDHEQKSSPEHINDERSEELYY